MKYIILVFSTFFISLINGMNHPLKTIGLFDSSTSESEFELIQQSDEKDTKSRDNKSQLFDQTLEETATKLTLEQLNTNEAIRVLIKELAETKEQLASITSR